MLPKIKRAVNKGTESAEGNQGFHAESPGKKTGPGFAIDFGAAVKKDNAGQDKNGPGQFSNGFRGKLCEKAGV